MGVLSDVQKKQKKLLLHFDLVNVSKFYFQVKRETNIREKFLVFFKAMAGPARVVKKGSEPT